MTAQPVRRVEFLLVLLLFSICAYVAAPFSFGDASVLVPPAGELDARQQTLIIADSIDKLLSEPRAFYDTAILYPDRHQLRTLEPILGYALLGLPLRTALRLNDVDVFEAVRWLVFFVCLTYAYLLFRAIGVDVALSFAGAVLCLSQPRLLNDVGRLNIICLPLILPVLYHGLMLWTSGDLRHSFGLFVFAALYPLCGMVNATLSLLAVLFTLPLLIKLLAGEPRNRVATLLLPILLAGALDAVVTAPWLLDRSDLAVYVSDEFLQIKHWNPMAAPGRLADIPAFVTGQVGLGMAAAFAMLCWLIPIAHFKQRAIGDAPAEPDLPAQAYLSVACAAALVLPFARSSEMTRAALPWLRIAFQVLCYATVLAYWRAQMRLVVSKDQRGARIFVVMLSAGIGVCLCLMSFGPRYVSNSSPLASHIMQVLLYVLPPLRAIREFYRVWILGILFLSVYVTIRLGSALRLSAPVTRAAAAVLILAAVMSSVSNRQLIASAKIEVPGDIVALAAHSSGKGAIYVHPYMLWNTEESIWMLPIARALRRPMVNGYLGIAPPWFGYASSVLHRFPDPESLWLLRKWQVSTVVSPAGSVQGAEFAPVGKAFENASGVVYEIDQSQPEVPHPSAAPCVPADGQARIDASVSRPERIDGGAAVTVALPRGFLLKRLEISFRPSVVEQIPESIDVYALQDASRARLNQDHSGEWIESLTADAFLHRRPPVATIGLDGAERRALLIEFRKAKRQGNTEQNTYADWWHLSLPPIERIGLCGEWAR